MTVRRDREDDDLIYDDLTYDDNDRDPGRDRNNRELMVTVYIFLFLFVSLILYFAYFVQFRAPKQIVSSYNMRQKNLENSVIRGTIYSDNKEVLAREALKDGAEIRNYPYASLFAHVVGFSTYGNYGLEKTANIELLTSNAPVDERLGKEMAGVRNTGDDIYTSLNISLQKTAYDVLANYRGAAIVMEAKTGRILAMVSKPDFDPNTVSENWAKITENEDEAALVNRCTAGLYPPGSTFKTVTLLEYLREHDLDGSDYAYSCNGSFVKDDSRIECYHGSVHGTVDLLRSYAKSCNCSFANIGAMLDIPRFEDTADSLLFGRALPVESDYKRSSFALNSSSDTDEILQTSIGQGKTLMTPMHLALITQAIANDGEMMRATLIDRQENYLGTVIREQKPSVYRRVMKEDEAKMLKSYMLDVVSEGTGKKLQSPYYTAAGKTGSAEYGSEKGKSHAWFTGFSQTGSPDIVVTIIIEKAGSGGDYAVPAAKRIFDAYYGVSAGGF
ncbi:MAG: penicillin-binding protein 2 [Lachnospiraceae bacterium]|nr:penicillin-binding protein 2 [Lachnospiraceae bacterium]